MAQKPGNFLIRLVLIVLVAGAIFFALDHFLSGKDATQAPPEAAAPATTPAATLTHDQAVQIGTEVGTRIGNEVGERIGRQVAAEMLAQRETEMAVKKAAAKPVSKKVAPVEPTPAEAPAPAPEPVAVAPTPAPTAEQPPPKPKPVHKKPAASAPTPETMAPAPVMAAQPPASATWWDKSLSDESDALVMRFAGQIKSYSESGGLALLFSGRFDKSSDFAGHIKVTGASGNVVPANWQLGSNPGLIFLNNIPKGRYTIEVTAGLKDADGKTLKKDVSGPVEVE